MRRPITSSGGLSSTLGSLAVRADSLDDVRSTYERITVELSPEERAAYEEARARYRDFVVSQGIRMSAPDGWAQFIIRSSGSVEGRRAFEAYRRQRQLAFAAPSKLEYLEGLLAQRIYPLHRLELAAKLRELPVLGDLLARMPGS